MPTAFANLIPNFQPYWKSSRTRKGCR